MVSDTGADPNPGADSVSIRFEVRGGFRLGFSVAIMSSYEVSIRFEVRGGFRRLPGV